MRPGPQSPRHHITELRHIPGRRNVGRHQIHQAVEGPDPHPVLHKIPLQGLGVDWLARFYHANAAQHAHIGHALKPGTGGKPLAQTDFKLGHTLLPVFFFKQVEQMAQDLTQRCIAALAKD